MRGFLANPNPETSGRRDTGAIDDDDDPSERFLLRCAWCNRIKVGDDFVPVEQAVAAELPERTTTHGICPECLERENERAAAARRAHAA